MLQVVQYILHCRIHTHFFHFCMNFVINLFGFLIFICLWHKRLYNEQKTLWVLGNVKSVFSRVEHNIMFNTCNKSRFPRTYEYYSLYKRLTYHYALRRRQKLCFSENQISCRPIWPCSETSGRYIKHAN